MTPPMRLLFFLRSLPLVALVAAGCADFDSAEDDFCKTRPEICGDAGGER